MSRYWVKRLDEVPTLEGEEPGATLVVVGGHRSDRFDSSWQPHHFEGVPQAE